MEVTWKYLAYCYLLQSKTLELSDDVYISYPKWSNADIYAMNGEIRKGLDLLFGTNIYLRQLNQSDTVSDY